MAGVGVGLVLEKNIRWCRESRVVRRTKTPFQPCPSANRALTLYPRKFKLSHSLEASIPLLHDLIALWIESCWDHASWTFLFPTAVVPLFTQAFLEIKSSKKRSFCLDWLFFFVCLSFYQTDMFHVKHSSNVGVAHNPIEYANLQGADGGRLADASTKQPSLLSAIVEAAIFRCNPILVIELPAGRRQLLVCFRGSEWGGY